MNEKHKLRNIGAQILEGTLDYVKYDISDAEYIGRFNGSLDECVDMLQECGYNYQLFAAIKYRDGSTDDGSFARFPTEHPSEVNNTALTERHPKECQYHVHLFETADGVDLYGHYEIAPRIFQPTFSFKRFWTEHRYPQWNDPDVDKSKWSYLRGVTDDRIEPHINRKA